MRLAAIKAYPDQLITDPPVHPPELVGDVETLRRHRGGRGNDGETS